MTIFHGLIGFVLHFGFWFSLAFYFINRVKINLKPLLPIFLCGILVQIIIAFIQYELPPDHFFNSYANIKELGGNGVALVGNRVRVTGTFSYLGGFTGFLTFLVFFVWYLFLINFNRYFVILIFFFALVLTFMSGSRLAYFQFLIVTFSFLYSSLNSKDLFRILQGVILILLFFIFVQLYFKEFDLIDTIEQSFSNFNTRVDENKSTGEQNQRILWDFQDLFYFRGKHPYFGVGLGSTYQGTTSYFGISDYVKDYGYYENELARIVLEGGFVLLLFRFLLFYWIFSLLKINKLTKFLLFVFFFYGSSIVFNIYNNIFLSLGIILLDNSYSKK